MSTNSTPNFSRLIRFQTSKESPVFIGQPKDNEIDVGLAALDLIKAPILVELFSGNSMISPGEPTGESVHLHTLLCPLSESEVGTIRCIGLNYKNHAAEIGMELPSVPILFMKPSTSLAGPFPFDSVVVPKVAQDESSDYESELCVIIGQDCKDVSEADSINYILGYTASNDISSRKAQFAQSQWGYSKGFDKACPIGPAVVSPSANPSLFYMKGILNGQIVQESSISDLVFSIPKLISFLSQGTTLKAGSIILTGTPFGVGCTRKPPIYLQHADDIRVEISGGIGTLVSKIVYE